ncbi:MAG: glycosyltransferase family 4 protein [Candidatus Cloacimonas sp.]|nr:glycosyltransferase family 4 protein [Candidatus Cloacimonas sp.]
MICHLGLGTALRVRCKVILPIIVYISGSKAANWIHSEYKKSQIDAVIYYGMLIPERMPICNVCARCQIPTFDEITEFPFLGRGKKLYRILELKLFMNYYLLKDSGILCISNSLCKHIQTHLQKAAKNIPVKLFGILVEDDKFRCLAASPQSSLPTDCDQYLAYCGSMYGDKDGVSDLIKALSFAKIKHPELKLVIMGDNSHKKRMHQIDEALESTNCRDSVIFTGRIPWEVMHQILCGAAALVLAKPKNIQNEGAFPTKLGEYLACGKPVLTTSVGDIPLFLKHKENALLSRPNDPIGFADNITLCLNDTTLKAKIAKNGLALAETVFSHANSAQELLNFITKVKGDISATSGEQLKTKKR